jgi:hypothetical protein
MLGVMWRAHSDSNREWHPEQPGLAAWRWLRVGQSVIFSDRAGVGKARIAPAVGHLAM